ncbi:hypothetical protein QJS66_00650 [Kocuria rhizophila]|nr:hypothetical protein QJS66_00650 [Kocuria rhizophila]
MIQPEVKERMQEVLADIQNGAFADRFMRDQASGAKEFKELRAKEETAPGGQSRLQARACCSRGADGRGLHRGHRRALIRVRAVPPPAAAGHANPDHDAACGASRRTRTAASSYPVVPCEGVAGR